MSIETAWACITYFVNVSKDNFCPDLSWFLTWKLFRCLHMLYSFTNIFFFFCPQSFLFLELVMHSCSLDILKCCTLILYGRSFDFLPVKMQAQQPTHCFAFDNFSFNLFKTVVFGSVIKFFKKVYKRFPNFWRTMQVL